VELLEYYALRSLNLPQPNDKNLVASKNDWVAREILGYIQIPQRYAPMINDGHEASLTSYLNNLHWPCSFRGVFVNSKGRERKRYPFHVHPLPARIGHPSLLKRDVDTPVGGIHYRHPACRAGVEGGGV